MKHLRSLLKSGLLLMIGMGLLCLQPALAQRVFVNGVPDPQKPKGASDVDMKIGAQVRVIPTWEKNFDFGMQDYVEEADDPADIQDFNTLMNLRSSDSHPRVHSSEAGRVSNEYWRVEAKLNFEFTPKDGMWNLFMSLECDTTLDTEEVDGRCRNYGLERLNGMINIPALNTRFHAGWDLYAIDALIKTEPSLSIGGAVAVYGDDDPGIWFEGGAGDFEWQIGYHKKVEFNATGSAQTRGSAIDGFARHPDAVNEDPDRNIYDASLTWHLPLTGNLLKFFWAKDQLHASSEYTEEAEYAYSVEPTSDLQDEHPNALHMNHNYYGVLYHGSFIDDILQVSFQYAVSNGTIKNTAIYNGKAIARAESQAENSADENDSMERFLKEDDDDYDIDTNMMYFNITSAFWGDKEKGVGGRIGISYLNTSGDDKDDDTLNGWTGIVAGQRFSQQIGTEHSIMGEQNPFLTGSQIYGYIPEYHGSRGEYANQGVVTGGLAAGRNIRDQNTQGGRGDNPGLTMWNIRVENKFNDHWVWRSQYRTFSVNEDYYPFLTRGLKKTRTDADGNEETYYEPVKDHDLGSEWSNELYYLINWNAIVQLTYVYFEPGAAIAKTNKIWTGKDDAKRAERTAMEFIWRF